MRVTDETCHISTLCGIAVVKITEIELLRDMGNIPIFFP